MSAMADTAAALKMDELDFFIHNAQFTDRPEIYREELKIAADLINYKQKAHLRGEGGGGLVRRGLGCSIHTWGGRGHESNCALTIYPTGSVEIQMGTQDLGVGTRTAILIVAGDTLGLQLNQIELKIGDNQYPKSGGSGGSTTIGGVSSSTRRAAIDAGDGENRSLASRVAASIARL